MHSRCAYIIYTPTSIAIVRNNNKKFEKMVIIENYASIIFVYYYVISYICNKRSSISTDGYTSLTLLWKQWRLSASPQEKQ